MTGRRLHHNKSGLMSFYDYNLSQKNYSSALVQAYQMGIIRIIRRKK